MLPSIGTGEGGKSVSKEKSLGIGGTLTGRDRGALCD